MKAIKQIFTCLFICALITGCTMREEGREADQKGEENNRNAGALNIGNSLGNPNLNLTNTTNTTNMNANKPGLRVATDAQDKVQNLPEVKDATIIVDNHNAYVAVVMDKDFHGEFTSYVEDQIALQVRRADTNIQNVYISTNRKFVAQMNQYRDTIQNGRTTPGITNGFNKMVKRVFVNHKG
jgi:spore cortex protein